MINNELGYYRDQIASGGVTSIPPCHLPHLHTINITRARVFCKQIYRGQGGEGSVIEKIFPVLQLPWSPPLWARRNIWCQNFKLANSFVLLSEKIKDSNALEIPSSFFLLTNTNTSQSSNSIDFVHKWVE